MGPTTRRLVCCMSGLRVAASLYRLAVESDLQSASGRKQKMSCLPAASREAVTTPELAGCLGGHEVRVPHISLVFRGIWVYREAFVQAPW